MQNTQDWLIAEYEFAWTSQSDINARIVAVYTQAVSVSLALLGAIGIWALGFSKGTPEGSAMLQFSLFALPNAITLVAFQHNIGQRRSIVQIAGYWKAMIDRPANRPTWASRMDAYRIVLNSDNQYKRLQGEANDPIASAYWVVFLATAVLACAAIISSPPAAQLRNSLYAIGALLAPCVILVWLTHNWRCVLILDYPLMYSAWNSVLSLESQSTKPEA